MNSVNIIGRLVEQDENDSCIRYCIVEKPFFFNSDDEAYDKVPLMNWNKEENGELFSFSNNTLVGIKGRVENYRNILVIVIESIIYLGAGKKDV